MRRLAALLVLALIFFLAVPVAADTIREFNITMSDARESYQIDYGATQTATLNRYWVNSSVDLLNVQRWTLHASNDGTAWSMLDEQTYYQLYANTPVEFVIAAPTNYTYYQFFMRDGFYVNGSILKVNFSADEATLKNPYNITYFSIIKGAVNDKILYILMGIVILIWAALYIVPWRFRKKKEEEDTIIQEDDDNAEQD